MHIWHVPRIKINQCSTQIEPLFYRLQISVLHTSLPQLKIQHYYYLIVYVVYLRDFWHGTWCHCEPACSYRPKSLGTTVMLELNWNLRASCDRGVNIRLCVECWLKIIRKCYGFAQRPLTNSAVHFGRHPLFRHPLFRHCVTVGVVLGGVGIAVCTRTFQRLIYSHCRRETNIVKITFIFHHHCYKRGKIVEIKMNNKNAHNAINLN